MYVNNRIEVGVYHEVLEDLKESL